MLTGHPKLPLGLLAAGILAAAGVPGVSDASAGSVDLGTTCQSQVAALPKTRYPDPITYPHFDPVVEALAPARLAGQELTVTMRFFGRPTRNAQAPEQRLGKALGGDARDVRFLWSGSFGIDVMAVRVEGADPRDVLSAALAVGMPTWEPWGPVGCSVLTSLTRPAFRITSQEQEVLAMPYQDAWLLVNAQLVPFDEVAREIDARLADLEQAGVVPLPPVQPEVGTSLIPPPSALALRARLPDSVRGLRLRYFGDALGQLGRGARRLDAHSEETYLTTAAALGVDPDTVWSDYALARKGMDGPYVSFRVVTDPGGSGSRWIAALLAANPDLEHDDGTPTVEELAAAAGYGSRVIAGRSVLMHKASDGSRDYLLSSGPWMFSVHSTDQRLGDALVAQLPVAD